MSKNASMPALQLTGDCLLSRAGSFQLRAAQAVLLRPQMDIALRITCGSAWVTLGDGRDYFLQKGQGLQAIKGSAVVIEPLNFSKGTASAAEPTETLYFDWDPVPLKVPKQRAHAPTRMLAPPSPQRRAVAQAWGDFRVALVAGFLASARLASALLGLLLPAALRATLGLADDLARNAHSSASCAQGRMAS